MTIILCYVMLCCLIFWAKYQAIYKIYEQNLMIRHALCYALLCWLMISLWKWLKQLPLNRWRLISKISQYVFYSLMSSISKKKINLCPFANLCCKDVVNYIIHIIIFAYLVFHLYIGHSKISTVVFRFNQGVGKSK